MRIQGARSTDEQLFFRRVAFPLALWVNVRFHVQFFFCMAHCAWVCKQITTFLPFRKQIPINAFRAIHDLDRSSKPTTSSIHLIHAASGRDAATCCRAPMFQYRSDYKDMVYGGFRQNVLKFASLCNQCENIQFQSIVSTLAWQGGAISASRAERAETHIRSQFGAQYWIETICK